VVVVWHQNPSYASYASQPGADLDLEILDSSGYNVVASSTSYDNTYEIVRFFAATSGTYTARVTKYRCDSTPKYIGLVWFQEP
jgi:hypothetical protein